MQSELSTYLQSDAYLNWAEQHSPSPIPLERLQDPLCGGNHPCQTLAETADQLDAFCKANDCVGLGNDVVGVGAGLLVVGAPLCGPAAPGCVVAGTYVGGASTVFGSGWTVYNFVNNNASNADLVVTVSLTARSLTTEDPRVALVVCQSSFCGWTNQVSRRNLDSAKWPLCQAPICQPSGTGRRWG